MNEKVTALAKRLFKCYRAYAEKRGRTATSSRYEKELSSLSPGREQKNLIEEYYIKKVANSLIIIALSLVIAVLAQLAQSGRRYISEQNTLERKASGKGNYSLILNARSEEYDYGSVAVDVEEKRLTKSEYDSMIEGVHDVILEKMLGENEDINHIDSELNLITSAEGYPCSIRWEVSDYMLLHNDGNFGELQADESGNDITLRAIITYKDLESVEEYSARIYPHRMTEEEKQNHDLVMAIEEANMGTSEADYMNLPLLVNGKAIIWTEKKEPIILILFLLTLVAVIAIWIGADRDLRKRYEDRNRCLLIEYSEFVSKLQLLLSSGLTIRGSLERMAAEYRKFRKEGGKRKYAYDELLLCVKKLQDGMSETAGYEYFGNRCGLICYKKLASLLIQNLRKGTDGVIVSLALESKIAFDNRKAIARKMGEEAQTKLLFPMIIMLMVVMIIIMIPAYLSFGT